MVGNPKLLAQASDDDVLASMVTKVLALPLTNLMGQNRFDVSISKLKSFVGICTYNLTMLLVIDAGCCRNYGIYGLLSNGAGCNSRS